MGLDIGDGEFDQPPHPSDWRQAADVELTLFAADVQIGVLEDREPERLLAAEVVVEHPLADASPRGDLVDSAPARPLAANSDVAAARMRRRVASGWRRRNPGASRLARELTASIALFIVRR